MTHSRPRLPAPSEPTVVYVGPGLSLAQVGNVHVSIYTVTPTVDLLAIDQKHHQALADREGHTAVLTLARHGLAIPDDEVRKAASALVRHNARFVRQAATVIEGDGFWASAARSSVTAVFILARQPYASRVFGTVDDAARWLTASATTTVTSMGEAVRALDSRRAAA